MFHPSSEIFVTNIMSSSMKLYLITDPVPYIKKRNESLQTVCRNINKNVKKCGKWLSDKGRVSTPLTLHYSVSFQNLLNSLEVC